MGTAELPEGTLTFLLTDLVASTRSWESSPAGMRESMARHDRIVAGCLRRHQGADVGRAGDSVLAVFRRAGDAAACALALQREFDAEPWPADMHVEARIAIHTGETELREGRYHGVALNRCARLLATCHGGQVLLTQATEQLLVDELPVGTALWDLGLHRLKDLTRPERVFQLVDLNRPAEFPPILSLARQLTNLPAQLTPFIGREEQLKELQEMHRQTRLLTLTGPGGAGKTRLALELAAQLVGEEADGVWLVELAPLSDPLLVPQAVASGLGLKEQPGRRMAETLVHHARQRRLLLVLDNCEHLVEPTATLAAELLKGCEGLTVLATSREPLNVPGELTWRVPPLTRDEAVRLFADRALSHDPRFRLTDENIQVVAQICDRLDFIPLAIELAAARVTAMPVHEILAHLESRFALLTGGDRTASSRLRTLRAAMDWSYDLLADPERIFFRRLSVFAGRFGLEAAEDVCADAAVPQESTLDLLVRLVDKSLVMVDKSLAILEGGRYRLLETVRTYGQERLLVAGETDAMQARLGAYVLSLAETRPPGQLAAWLDRLEAAHDDIRNTLRWTVKADPDLGVRLAVALTIFWQLRGHASEPRQFMDDLLRYAPAGFRTHAAGLQLAGTFAYLQADFDAARQLLATGLEEARAIGDRLTVLRTLAVLGLVGTAIGDLAASKAALEEALTLARESGEREEEAGILHQLALLAGRRNDLEESRTLFDESIALRRAQGRTDEASMSLTYLAGVALLQGDLATARRCVGESLELGRAMRDRRSAFSLDVLACLTGFDGNMKRAVVLAGAGSAMHEGSGNTPPQVWGDLMSAFLQPAREALGEHAAGAAWETGRRMDYEDALQLALNTVSGRGQATQDFESSMAPASSGPE
ncbi:MAG TPA: AAA family ATPase [Candidatus Dormibacteraeota bacterium]|nr:AAA family ATPase [Candidatus Dormibacteraeota bacterium]